MFHHRTLKFLSSLIIFAVFCAGRVSAAPDSGINQAEKNFTPPSAPMLADGGLTCNGAAAGVTCTDYGTYLDYSINIHVTGLTGGATASDIYIGSFMRSTNGGEMGMTSDFVHFETSVYPQNSVFSMVAIQPFDASAAVYTAFTSSSGTNVGVTNKVSDWRYIGGSGGWPNWLSIKGDVNWPITGYSIVGHIYLYSVPAVELTGIEVTQVVQDLNNSVTLIADKPTYVRAHVKSRNPSDLVENVTVSLSAYRDGVLLGTLKPENLNGGYIDVKESLYPDTRELRAELEESFYFKIPKSWEDAGTVRFKINDVSHHILCAEQDPNDALNNCEVSVDFVDGPIPNVKFVRISVQDGSNIRPYPTAGDISKVRAQLRATLPMPWLNWGYRYYDGVIPAPVTDNDFEILNSKLYALKFFDWSCGGNCYYIGILPGLSLDQTGWVNAINSPLVGSGYFDDFTTIPHEYSHVSLRLHTYCREDEAFTNPLYPYIRGRISDYTTGNNAFYGFNTLNLISPDPTMETIYGPSTGDLMSYCSPRWSSDYTYEGVFNSDISLFGTYEDPHVPLNNSQPSVIVSGLINSGGLTGNLNSIYTVEAVPNVPTSGTYAIRFEDASNQEIASYSFEPQFSGESASDVSAFVFALPAHNNVDHIILLNGNNVIDTHTASNNAPVVNVISPNGGELLSGSTATISWSANDADNDTLVYVIQYSSDGGSTWEPLVTDWPNTTLDINPSLIAGTEAGLIRVLASDGFLTSQDQSNAVFSVTKKAPQVEIDTHDNAVFASDQTVTLEGGGYDLEDGQLSGSSLQWSSSLDGVLGQGESISINAQNLTEGIHTITLTAQDSDLQTGTASITIRIYRQFSSLSVDTVPLNFTAWQNGSGTTEQFVSVWHLGDHPLTWSATADQSWIVLRSTGSNTPADLIVSANPAGLSVGTYTGAITFTSNAEGINTQTVPVMFEVQISPVSTVNTFTASSSSTSLNIPITSFTASDDESVTGYLITESDTPPLAGDTGWSVTPPSTYTVGSDGNYTLYPWVKNVAGNVSPVFASPASVTVDTTPPTVLLSIRANPDPTNASSVDFTVTFSEAVTGVDTTDFVLTQPSVPGAVISGVSGTGNVYTVSVNTGSGSGTIHLEVIDDDSIIDTANNPLGGTGAGNGNFTAGETYTVDRTPPTVISSVRTPTVPPATSQVSFLVTFSEDVTGVDKGDFSLTLTGNKQTSSTISSVNGSGNVYTVKVNTGSGAGTIRLNVLDDDTIKDEVNNTLNGGLTTGEMYTISSLTITSVGNSDGWILESTETSNVGGTLDVSSTKLYIGDGENKQQSLNNLQYRSILHFDTSALPDTAIITSTALTIRQAGLSGTNPFTTHGSLVADIQNPYYGSAVGLALDDFDATAGALEVATFGSTPVQGSYYTAILDIIGYPYMNLTGTTQFRLRFTLDDNNDNSSDAMLFNSGNDITNYRPKLVIDYYVP